MAYKHPICYICKQPVNLLSYATGENGKPVHTECFMAKKNTPSLYEHVANKNKKAIADWEKRAESGEIMRII